MLKISYIIIWSLALANVVGTSTCLLLSNRISKITTIPYGYVAPFMLMIIFFAALQATRSLEDLVLLISIGALGTLFKYFDWPRPALLIGFVLAETIETYYYQAVQFYAWDMLERPGVLMLIFLMLVSILLSIFFKKRNTKKDKEKGIVKEDTNPNHVYTFITGELLFVWLLMAFALYALFNSIPHQFLGGIFPIVISSILLIFGVLLSFQLVSKKKQKDVLATELTYNGELTTEWKETWSNFLILPIFLFGVWILGFLPALIIMFLGVIRTKMNAPWWKIMLTTVIGVGFLFFVSQIMSLHLPEGLIADFIFKA